MEMMLLVIAALLADAAPLAAEAGQMPGLVVRHSELSNGPCSWTASLTEMLRSRLPGVRVVEGTFVEDFELGLSLAPAGERWRLELRQGDGQVALRRELAGGHGRCADVAETSALIIERYMREVSWSGRPLALTRMQAAESVASTAHDQSWLRRLTLAAGVGWMVALRGGMAPALSVEIATRIGERLRLSASFAFSPLDIATVVVQGEALGSMTTRAVLSSIRAGTCTRTPGSLSLCGGLAGGAATLTGNSEGVYGSRLAFATVPTLGGYGVAVYRLRSSLSLSGELAVVLPLGTARVAVEGTTAETATAPLGAVATLGLAWAF